MQLRVNSLRRQQTERSSEYEDILRRDLFLAARCLGDCEAVEPLLAREVAGELVAICLDRQGKGEYASLRQLASATVGLLRHGEAGNEAVRLLLAALKDGDWQVRSAVWEALNRLVQA